MSFQRCLYLLNFTILYWHFCALRNLFSKSRQIYLSIRQTLVSANYAFIILNLSRIMINYSRINQDCLIDLSFRWSYYLRGDSFCFTLWVSDLLWLHLSHQFFLVQFTCGSICRSYWTFSSSNCYRQFLVHFFCI
jgi:hypothetical protein